MVVQYVCFAPKEHFWVHHFTESLIYYWNTLICKYDLLNCRFELHINKYRWCQRIRLYHIDSSVVSPHKMPISQNKHYTHVMNWPYDECWCNSFFSTNDTFHTSTNKKVIEVIEMHHFCPRNHLELTRTLY